LVIVDPVTETPEGHEIELVAPLQETVCPLTLTEPRETSHEHDIKATIKQSKLEAEIERGSKFRGLGREKKPTRPRNLPRQRRAVIAGHKLS
jgi:hypothetical protein